MTEPPVTIVGLLSLDHITCRSGTFENVPGGAAYYCAAAAAVAGARVRLVAKAGSDFPLDALRVIERLGVDTRSVERISAPSRRSRLHDPSGGDRSLPHVDDPAWWDALKCFAPPVPQGSGIFVYTAMPPDMLLEQFDARGRDDTLIVDTSPAYASRSGKELLALVPRFDCFAPSREETRLLLPGLDDDAALEELSRHVPIVAHKRGADGLALKRRGVKAIRAGSVAANVIDTTGAGDSVVGALAAGFSKKLDDPTILNRCSQIAALTVSAVGIDGLARRRSGALSEASAPI
jgi:sugar/nucleoside kinase (ribokinase family)